nr:MAG TPA: hypothetical protein [Crassvirales sp.]
MFKLPFEFIYNSLSFDCIYFYQRSKPNIPPYAGFYFSSGSDIVFTSNIISIVYY